MVYNVEDKPKLSHSIGVGFQHILSIVSGTILVPMLIGLPHQVSAALFGCGLGTLVYIFITKRKSPVIISSNFAFIAALVTAYSEGGYFGILLGGLFTGLVYILLSIIIKFTGTNWIQKVFPPILIGPVVALIGLFRQMFYHEDDLSSWRMVFLIPAIMGIVVALICIPIVKETPVFLKNKAKNKDSNNKKLEDEENKDVAKSIDVKEADKDVSDSKPRGGVKNAFIYIFKNPQVRRIMIAAVAFALVTGITSYYTTVLEVSEDSGIITDSMISMVLMIFPFVNGLFTLICGFLSDAMGRKNACFLFSAVAIAGLVIFVLGTQFGWSQIVIGIGWGMFIGTLWSITDTLVLVMPSEATPTDMRASVLGVMSLILSAGMALSIIIFTVAMNVFGTNLLGIVSLCICIPLTIVACILLAKVKETKGNNLDV